jgi:glycosyltransferase involved in cell wall biosynthesis
MLGAESVIVELCKGSVENGFDTIIGAIKNVADPQPEIVKVAADNMFKTKMFECVNQFDLRCGRYIRDYVRNMNVDIVHAHGYKEDYFSLLANLKVPKVATNHLWKRKSLKNKFYCFLDAKFLKHFDRVVGVSNEIVEEMRRKKIKNTMKIDNGVDVKRFANVQKSKKYCKEFGVDDSTVVIGMISSLAPEKGHAFALNAFANLLKLKNNLKLLIVGNGKDSEKLIRMAETLQIKDHVVFAGKRAEIPEILSVIDIYLLSSITEGTPMALLEAMAAKKAVIATDVGDIPDVIESGKNGLLIRSQDITGIENAITTICEDSNKRELLGNNAFITVQQRYSADHMVKKYCDVYAELLTAK